MLLVSLPALTVSRSWKAWKLVMTDLRLAELFKLMAGDDVALAVVVVGVVRQEDAQPVADRDAGGDDQKAFGEAGILRIRELVRVPARR